MIDLTRIPDDYLPRTNYVPDMPISEFTRKIRGFEVGKDKNGKPVYDKWVDYYKVIWRRMVGAASERTLQSTIAPPKTSHVNTVNSMLFKQLKPVIELSAVMSSLVFDFYIKSTGKGDIRGNIVKHMPIGFEDKFRDRIAVRTLLLNCLNYKYIEIWNGLYKDAYRYDRWTIRDVRLQDFDKLKVEWSSEYPLRNFFERRQALVEIDVLVAMALGVTLEDLILMYRVQFPVLQQNENNTWYDAKGNVIFTCSKGLAGVGLDRSEWDAITKEDGPNRRTLKKGDSYTHTIEKSELYRGEPITYYPPFDRCDREEDYRIAWEHFERELGNT